MSPSAEPGFWNSATQNTNDIRDFEATLFTNPGATHFSNTEEDFMGCISLAARVEDKVGRSLNLDDLFVLYHCTSIA